MARLVFAFVWYLVFAPVSLGARSYPGVGLEVDNPHVLAYVIGDIPPDAARLGVSVERVREVVETRLRSAGIRPRVEALEDHHLEIRFRAAGSAIEVSLLFVRTVTYTVKATSYVVVAPTWQAARVGVYEGDPRNSVSSLDALLDRFVEEFQSANRSD